MIEFFYQLIVEYRHEFEQWTLYMAWFAIWTFVFALIAVLGWIYRHTYHWRSYEDQGHPITVLVTVFDETEEVLSECLSLLRNSLEEYCGKDNYAIYVMVDGMDLFPEEGKRAATIAREYVNYVMGSDFRSKRMNLYHLVLNARARGELYDHLGLMDSDTRLCHQKVIRYLMRPFSWKGRWKVGGVTTSQSGWNLDNIPAKITNWTEWSRYYGSMPSASLFGQVVCLPGRLYIVLTELVEHRMKELATETWWTLNGRVPAHAGDDRRITTFVLEAGCHSVQAPDAPVVTILPHTWDKFWKTWRRWLTSSRGYTILDTSKRWFWRCWYGFLYYWKDIFLGVGTALLLFVYLPYQMGYGAREVPLWFSIMAILVGPMVTMCVRQIPYISKEPRTALPLLPIFAFVALVLQLMSVRAIFQRQRISMWGTRKGADEEKQRETSCWPMMKTQT